ncbi:MAG: hypothetical protein WC686_04310 [Candidatus Shapirobacteria bacterium]|jgi:hypothetical protein
MNRVERARLANIKREEWIRQMMDIYGVTRKEVLRSDRRMVQAVEEGVARLRATMIEERRLRSPGATEMVVIRRG